MSVIDTGIGISKEDQKKLFQMFVQSGAIRGTSVAHNGTGLGLAICKRLVEKMNGSIRLTSELQQGADFTVILRNVPYHISMKQESKADTLLPANGTMQLSSYRVLITDDIPLNLKVLSAMLQKLGIHSLTATNAEEALATLNESPVDFFLTDLWMPGMNGAELVNIIRRSGKFPNLRIAAITADVGSGDNFDMSGFDAILAKPITLDKLRAFLEKKKEEA